MRSIDEDSDSGETIILIINVKEKKMTSKAAKYSILWFSTEFEVYTTKPALVKIPKKVTISRIISQLPILAAPWGKGLLESLRKVILFAYILPTFYAKAKIKQAG